jgi:hypothetical protein
MNKKSLLIALGIVLSLGVLSWTDDFVRLKGERTIYTVDCRNGSWDGLRCTGKLMASDRVRYRALKPHKEVFFWVVGSSEPSGKFTDCDIHDGQNWTCKANGDAPRSITLELDRGKAVHKLGNITRPFRATTKFHWLLLRAGVDLFDAASY